MRRYDHAAGAAPCRELVSADAQLASGGPGRQSKGVWILHRQYESNDRGAGRERLDQRSVQGHGRCREVSWQHRAQTARGNREQESREGCDAVEQRRPAEPHSPRAFNSWRERNRSPPSALQNDERGTQTLGLLLHRCQSPGAGERLKDIDLAGFTAAIG